MSFLNQEEYLKETITIIKKIFGEDVNIEIVDRPIANFCLQNFTFAKVTKGSQSFNVVRKGPISEEIRAYFLDSYRNESLWYKQILPNYSQEVQNLFPKCYHATPNENIEATGELSLVLEDLYAEDYHDLTHRVLNEEKLLLAIKLLANLHAEGLVFKLKKPLEHTKLTEKIKESMMVNDDGSPMRKFMIQLVEVQCIRCLESYMFKIKNTKPEIYKKGEQLIAKIKDEGIDNITANLRAEKSETNVLCHGDFNGNNIMYKENKDDTISIKAYDMQKICYSSRVIDLAFILFYNTESTKVSKEMWDKIWNVYHSTFMDHVKYNMGENYVLSKNWSKENLLADFKRKCFYGYQIATYFLPLIKILRGEIVGLFCAYMEDKEKKRAAGELKDSFDDEYLRETCAKIEIKEAAKYIDDLTEHFLELYEE